MELFSLENWTSNHSDVLSPSHFLLEFISFFIYVTVQAISFQYTFFAAAIMQ